MTTSEDQMRKNQDRMHDPKLDHRRLTRPGSNVNSRRIADRLNGRSRQNPPKPRQLQRMQKEIARDREQTKQTHRRNVRAKEGKTRTRGKKR